MNRPANHCFVCGRDNPIGLKLVFQRVGEGVKAEFEPSDLHVGYDGVVHGGIISALVDDALANVWAAPGREAITAKIEVRFRQPVRPGDHLVIDAQPTGKKAGMHAGKVEIRRDGVLVADGSGLLIVRS